MRVEVKNGVIVCSAADWNKLADNERKFLSACYWTACWTDFDEEGNLVMRKSSYEADTYRTLINVLVNAANNHVEVTDEARAYKERYKTAVMEEERRQKESHEAEIARERWDSRKKHGCDYCKYCLKMGDGWFKCVYSGDELDSRLGEHWNVERGVYELFHESGEPNEHCKDFYKETKKRRV